MGKGKKEKENNFNLADYDYLDKLPLEGWIWEFARRSPEYKKEYTRFKAFEKTCENNLQAEDILKNSETIQRNIAKQFEIARLFLFKNPNERWTGKDNLFMFGVTKFSPIEVLNLKWRVRSRKKGDKDEYFLEPYPLAESMHVNVDNEVTIKYRIKEPYEIYSHPFNFLFQCQGKENVIMALIDISAPESLDNILKELKSVLYAWRKRLKLPKSKDAKTPQKNPNKLLEKTKIWKSYLIIHDLVKKDLSFKKISDILANYDDYYASEKKIRSHYETAKKLINGGYNKYLA